ncbi:MAG: hypothetical protein JWN48_4884 [Myxococcaceae bacterium]|nr:hypothetical protein [Myxococcaceae bacterium]
MYVACSRTLVDPENADTEVVLYRLDSALQANVLASVGRAGRDGHGVALSATQSAIYVAFHDGSIGEHAIVLATVENDAVRTLRLSHVGQVASEPALLAEGGHVYVTYSELELTRDGAPASTVWLSRDGEPARLIARTATYSPTPKLTRDAASLVLSYRDRHRGTRSELYVVRLDDHGKRVGEPRGVGRANTDGEPSVFGCGELTTALLPREYGGERFVGINALDRELSSVGAGHQLYATGREFVQASGTCLGNGWLLFAADRAAPGKPGSEAVSMHFSCAR